MVNRAYDDLWTYFLRLLFAVGSVIVGYYWIEAAEGSPGELPDIPAGVLAALAFLGGSKAIGRTVHGLAKRLEGN